MASADRAIQHVVFDIGGVLMGHVRTWGEAYERLALPADAYLDSAEWAEATRESVVAHMSGRIAPDAWCEEVARLSQGRLTPVQARTVLEAWLDEEDYPGVAEVIEAIHAAGRNTATLSNTNPVHWEQMLSGRSPALGLIQFPHASHLLGATKPELAIYQAFEQATGFARAEVLFFDDLEENVATALEFGWHAEVIDHTGDPAAQLREHLARYGVVEG